MGHQNSQKKLFNKEQTHSEHCYCRCHQKLEHLEWWMEGKTEKGCVLFISAEENEKKNRLNVIVDVHTDSSVQGSQLCLVSLAASVEFCEGESILISTNRKTGIWQRARAPLTPRLLECRCAFAIQVLSPLSYVLDVAASFFSPWDIMVTRFLFFF